MRKLAAVVVALAAVAAGLPALLGALTQGRISKLAEAASASQFFEVSITGYQRGWRNSRAFLTVALSERYKAIFEGPFSQGSGPPDILQGLQDLLGFELQLAVDIVHGPLLTQDGVGAGLADAVVQVDPGLPRGWTSCLPIWARKAPARSSRVSASVAFRSFAGEFRG